MSDDLIARLTDPQVRNVEGLRMWAAEHIAAQAAEIARLKAALAEAQHVPKGWWVAPKEATQEMIGAAVGCGWGGFASAYRAMRDAAPQPPQEGG